MAHAERLLGDSPQHVFFPLCGADVSMAHLARRGHRVVGVEGVRTAVDKALSTYGDEVPPAIGMRAAHGLTVRAACSPGHPDLTVVQGDFLSLDEGQLSRLGMLGAFSFAFDRGALVAINQPDHVAYAATLSSLLAPGGSVLLAAVKHDMASTAGPPFSITEAELLRLYPSRHFEVRVLERSNELIDQPSEAKFKARGATSFVEVAWLIIKRESA